MIIDGSIPIGALTYIDMFNQRLCVVFFLQRFLCQLSVIMAVAMINALAEKQCRSMNTQEP